MLNNVGVTQRELSRLIGVHFNTVGNIFRGDRANYTTVHRLFTEMNVHLSDTESRYDHVLYADEEQSYNDEALKQCAVFPNVNMYLKRLNINAKEIGDRANVRTVYVRYMSEGRPVARNLVRAVITTMAELIGSEFNEDGEIFN